MHPVTVNDELNHAHHHAPTAPDLPLGHAGIACYAKAGIGELTYRKFRDQVQGTLTPQASRFHIWLVEPEFR